MDKMIPIFKDDWWPTIWVWKDSLSEKWVLNYITLGSPFIRGFSSHEWNETHPLTMAAAKCTPVKSFTCWKVSAKPWNFRVPVYKGVLLPWMKWYPSFTNDCRPSIRVWKLSLSEKWVLNNTTSGFPFLRGFPSHESSFHDDWWPTIRMWKVSLSEKWVFNFETLGFPFIRGFPSHWWSDTHP